MCGRYDNRIPAQKVVDYFNLTLDSAENLESFRPNHNVCPTQTVPIITCDEPDRLSFARWGLIPFWAKDEKIGAKMINARCETVAEKPAFRNAFSRRRCLVPATAFYEWRKDVRGKTPLRFSIADEELFAFAGLWEVWKPPGADTPVWSCTILTTSANELVAPAHDRMPVILPREADALWLERAATPEQLAPLLCPFPADRMVCSEVTPGVLSVR